LITINQYPPKVKNIIYQITTISMISWELVALGREASQQTV